MSVTSENQRSWVQDAQTVYQIAKTLMELGPIVGRAWSVMTNGVTNVKEWENRTSRELEVYKFDHGSQPEDHYRIPPGQTFRGDMWIPWADNAAQFSRKRAVFVVEGRPFAAVWQSGKKVRFNTRAEFMPGGYAVPGANGAGGDRRVTFFEAAPDVGFLFTWI